MSGVKSPDEVKALVEHEDEAVKEPGKLTSIASADFVVPTIVPSPAAVQLGRELNTRLREFGTPVNSMATRKPVTAPSSASRKNVSTPTKDTVNKNKNKNRDTTDNKRGKVHV